MNLGRENQMRMHDLQNGIMNTEVDLKAAEDTGRNKLIMLRQQSGEDNAQLIDNWKRAYEESMLQYERLRGAGEDISREIVRLKGMDIGQRMDFEEGVREEERRVMDRQKEKYSKTIYRVEDTMLREEKNRMNMMRKNEDLELNMNTKRRDL